MNASKDVLLQQWCWTFTERFTYPISQPATLSGIAVTIKVMIAHTIWLLVQLFSNSPVCTQLEQAKINLACDDLEPFV